MSDTQGSSSAPLALLTEEELSAIEGAESLAFSHYGLRIPEFLGYRIFCTHTGRNPFIDYTFSHVLLAPEPVLRFETLHREFEDVYCD